MPPQRVRGANPAVIALGGAAGYLPGNTLEGTAYAHALGVDAIALMVALTENDTLVALPDVRLDVITDVAARFPRRARQSRQYCVSDFSLKEILTLTVYPRFDRHEGGVLPANGFPPAMGSFRVATLAEHIELIQGLNHSTSRNVGVHVALAAGLWQNQQERPLYDAILEILDRYGYRNETDRAVILCPGPGVLRNLRSRCNLRLIGLLDGGENGKNGQLTADVLAALDVGSPEATGVAPRFDALVQATTERGGWTLTALGVEARRRGVSIYPVLRGSHADGPGPTGEYSRQVVFDELRAEGVYSEYPDRVVAWLCSAGYRKRRAPQ